MGSLGRHLIVELYECDEEILNDVEKIKDILNETAKKINANILDNTFYKFSPQGVSGVILIAESHISIHTWPEYKYAGCDVFSCGNNVVLDECVSYLQEKFKAKYVEIVNLTRGKKIDIKNKDKNLIHI